MQVGLGGAITVSATERWLTDLRAGRAFSRGGFSGATAANYSHVQLFNPAASAVTLLVRALITSVGVLGTVLISTYNTALTTLIGAGTNLLAGAAAGLGECRSQDNAAQFGTEVSRISLQSSTPYFASPDWLMELGPGEGVLVVPTGQNVQITAAYYWLEVS